MMFDLWTFLHLVPLLALAYFYINRRYSYWSNKGVRGPRPLFPIGTQYLKAMHRPDEIELKWQQEYGKVYGVYTGLTPTLTITDPELIKQVLVKDFHHFINRRNLHTYHHIWNANLFFLEGDDWKRVRSITSPAFTSGKLRNMYPLMGECIDRLVEYFGQAAGSSLVFNTKEVMAGFTIDVIASSAFATVTNANSKDANREENSFVHHGMNLFKISPFKLMLAMALPSPFCLRVLGIDHFFPDDSFKFMVNLSSKIIEHRKQNKDAQGENRHDLVKLLMDSFTYEEDLKSATNYEKLTAGLDIEDESNNKSATNEKDASAAKTKKVLTHDEIIAQCLVFFIAGFETTATTLGHALFELSQNPEVQQKLFEEIEQATEGMDVDGKSQQQAYFDKLCHDVPYLDATIKETLRKYPPVVRLERRVGSDGLKIGGIPLDKGSLIEIPTVAVQRNPEFYPEPLRFSPERFLPENKHLLVPYTYLPFGDGPRNCIGMRFAYQEVKLCIASLVRKFRFEPTAKTPSKTVNRRGNILLNCMPFELKVSVR